MSTKHKKSPIERDAEIQGAKRFGQHVSKEKGRLLLLITLLACLAPMLMGLRFWDMIPELYETGLVTNEGKDDSLPRWAIVFVLPGLMCLLNFLCHNQLRMSQARLVLPKTYFRLVGRWGFPIISVLFVGGFIRETAGLRPLAMTYLTPAALGLGVMLLGSHMYECKEGSFVSLGFSFMQGDSVLWADTHRFAGRLWLFAGLLAVVLAQVSEVAGMASCVVLIAALAAPYLYARRRAAERP